MSRAWLVLVACVLACARIREVEVEPGTSSESTGGPASSETTGAGTTGAPDVDTEGSPSDTSSVATTGSSDGSTEGSTGGSGAREMFCGAPFQLGDVEIPDLVIEDARTILDLDVSVRAQHAQLATLELALVRDGVAVALLAAGELECGPELAAIFDDEAALEAAQVCDAPPPARWILRPVDPLGVHEGSGVAGSWRLQATGEPPAGIDAWCLNAVLAP